MKNLRQFIGISGHTALIYFLTKAPYISNYALQMTLVSLIALVFYAYWSKKAKRGSVAKSVIFITTFVLFLVGATGWFFSPFFFSLYLLAIAIAFIFTSAVSIAFVTTLVILFSFNIGEVDLAYDFLIVLSLLTVIPMSLYLRGEYIKLKESAKEILVLQDSKKEFDDKVEEILANKVNNIAVNLRQPINDTKQLAYLLSKDRDSKEFEKLKERIIAASEDALRMLKIFEEGTTGRKLMSTPKKS